MSSLDQFPQAILGNDYIVIPNTDECMTCGEQVDVFDLFDDRCSACRASLWSQDSKTVAAEIKAGTRCVVCALPLEAEDIGRRDACAFCRG